ncbi:MAG TPA: MFS transporter [Thermoplasmata archaeon]|nr:MFS transporter [Thermoplasmata archaeon]
MEYKWTVLSNTTLGGLLASIDGSILLIALPVVFRGLGVNPFDASNFPILLWLLLGYGVVTATLLVTVGRLSDMLGRARMYNFGFAIFSTGSILLFVEPWPGATGAWALVVFRLVQAVGASFLFANSLALLTDAFPPRERGKAIGVNQIAFIGGSLLGLVIGGILAGVPDIHIGPFVLPTWRLIFLVSVPVGVAGTIWAYRSLRETSTRAANQKVDYLGNISFALGLTLILVGITYGLLPYGGSSMGWASPWVIGAIGGGVATLVAFVFIESRVPDPMFRLSFFRIRAFAAGATATLLGSLARGGMMLLLVIWFQGIWLPLHGYSFATTPFWAGIMMTPLIAGFLVAGPLSGYLSDTRGARTLATSGMLLGAGAFIGLAFLPVDFAYWQVGVLLFVNGCGMGMFAAPNASAVMSAVPAQNRGAASGMLTTLQNAGQQLSLAIFFTVVIIGLSNGLGGGAQSVLGGAGVPPADGTILGHLIAANPTGALFGAFLGVNPMSQLLQVAPTIPGWVPLSPSTQQALLAPHFFAATVAPGFGSALSEAFLFAAGLTLVAAAISALRGGQYFHTEAAVARDAPATMGPTGAEPAPRAEASSAAPSPKSP